MNTNITDADIRSIHPSEADYPVSEQFSFYGMRLLVSRPTPKPRGIIIIIIIIIVM
jgi:hypothetical protein